MNNYLIVWGVRVSGYTQYTGIEFLEGDSIDQAFNYNYLSDPPKGTAVVMEAYKLERGGEEGEYIHPVRLI